MRSRTASQLWIIAAIALLAVIDPQSGRVYATLYNDSNLADYEGAVNRVLKELKAAGR